MARRTQAQMTAFNEAIWDICYKHKPLTGRHCYYRAVVARLIDKDTGKSRENAKKVGRALDTMREHGVDLYGTFGAKETEDPRTLRTLGVMPFGWLKDNTRHRLRAELHGSKEDALADIARLYRRDLWRSQPWHVEVWCESDSIANVLLDVTDEFGVALLPCKGQSSKRFVWDSARSYARLGKPVTCLYVGDFDPAGLDIGNSVKTRLARYGAPDVEFRRIAITPEQVRDMGLPGHGLNPNLADPVRRRFTNICDRYGIPREAVEAEAMPPDVLRGLLREAVSGYIDTRQWALEKTIEAGERLDLRAMARAA